MNKGTAFQEAIQEKPLLAMMESKKKTFPGGKGNIIVSVKGDYGNTAAPGTADQLVGYEQSDTRHLLHACEPHAGDLPLEGASHRHHAHAH